jgi:hypothetical protein
MYNSVRCNSLFFLADWEQTSASGTNICTRSASYVHTNSSHKNTFTLRQTTSLTETHTNKELKRRRGCRMKQIATVIRPHEVERWGLGTGRFQRQQIPFSSALSGNLKQSELAMAGPIIIMKSLMAQFSFRLLHPVFSNVTEWSCRNLRRKLYERERDITREPSSDANKWATKDDCGSGRPSSTHKVTKT